MTRSIRAKKRKKESMANRMALLGITMVVLSLAIAVHLKGFDLKRQYSGYENRALNLEAQLSDEKKRSEELKQYGVYVQTKQYIEKVAKEKLGLVNKDEILLKPKN